MSHSPSYSSQSLPPLPEDPANQDLHTPTPSQSTTHGRHSTASDSPAPSTLSADLGRVDSSLSQSTSNANGSNKRRWLFGIKRSQTNPATSPGIDSDPSLPRRSSSSNSSLHPGPPSAIPPPSRTRTTPTGPPSPSSTRTTTTGPPSPSRTRTMPTEPPSPRRTRTMPQPARAATIAIDLPQSRNWEPVSPAVLRSLEMAASDSESLLRPAWDGTVSAGNLEGLVSRVITDFKDPPRNDLFRATFLTIYQLFATSERLFEILKRRFESCELDPVASLSRYP